MFLKKKQDMEILFLAVRVVHELYTVDIVLEDK